MIIIDVETTGLNSKENSIVSIGAVELNNPKNQFYGECQIFEGAQITTQALDINGFTLEEVQDKNKNTLKELIEKFLQWLSQIKGLKTLIGENPSFDRDFLFESCKKYNLQYPLGFRTIDIHALSISKYLEKNIEIPQFNSQSKLSLNKTLEFCGLPKEPNPHNALRGAKYEAEAYSRLVLGKKLLEEFNEFEIPEFLKQN